MAWLSGWNYRKSHVINYAAGAGANYQKRITVHYGSGSDSGEDVYLNSHSRTDFGDVRFTDNDQTTELDYWMEKKVDSDHAIFWVEVADDLSTENVTIYIYYGKADATTASNGANTFLGFSHFTGIPANEGEGAFKITDGTWLDADGYGAGANAHGPRCNFTIPSTGNFFFRFVVKNDYITSSAQGGIIAFFNNGATIVYGVQLSDFSTGSNCSYLRLGKSFPAYSDYVATDLYNSGCLADWLEGTWTIELKRVGSTLTLYIDDVQKYSGDSGLNTAIDKIKLMLRQHGAITIVDITRIDYFFIRKYVSPEPGHGAWGSEETPVKKAKPASIIPLMRVMDMLGLRRGF